MKGNESTPSSKRRLLYISGIALLSILTFFLSQLGSVTPEISDTERIQQIAYTCGPLCDVEAGEMRLDTKSNRTYRNVPVSRERCHALYSSPYIGKGLPRGTREAPRKLPAKERHLFLLDGRMRLSKRYYNDLSLDNKKIRRVWTRGIMERAISDVKRSKLYGTYGTRATSELLRLLRHVGVIGAHVLVIGSQRPWVEAAALAAGARKTVTLEYAKVVCEDPRMEAYTPSEFGRRVLAGRMPHFDVIVSYSSTEHTGLGRYGDALNPWGDIISIAMAWCVAHEDATLVLEVPRAESDVLIFNEQWRYGPVRLPLVTTNWLPVVDENDESWGPKLGVLGGLPRPLAYKRMP